MCANRRRCGVLLAVGFVLLAPPPSDAADLFSVTAVVGADTRTVHPQTAQQLVDAVRDQDLKLLVPSYTGSEAASLTVDFRGQLIQTAFPTAGSTRLDLDVPGLGITRSFVGATRQQSREMLRDFLKTSDAMGRIMKALARSSAVDPVAGNPASLQTRLVAGNYNRHFRLLASERTARDLGIQPQAQAQAAMPILLASAADEPPAIAPLVIDKADSATMVELDAARYTAAGRASVVANLSFSHALPTAPDRPLSIEGDLQHADVDGATSIGGTLGMAYRMRVKENWYLVPSVSVGAVESRDLGSAGTMVSASLTSAWRLARGSDYIVWIGNAATLTQTVNASIGGYSFDPKLRNLVLTNGAVAYLTPAALGRNQWLEVSLADSRYTGSAIYDRRYDEMGIALVRSRRSSGGPGRGPATLRAELNYLDTTHSKGWALRLRATF